MEQAAVIEIAPCT